MKTRYCNNILLYFSFKMLLMVQSHNEYDRNERNLRKMTHKNEEYNFLQKHKYFGEENITIKNLNYEKSKLQSIFLFFNSFK